MDSPDPADSRQKGAATEDRLPRRAASKVWTPVEVLTPLKHPRTDRREGGLVSGAQIDSSGIR